MSPTYRSLLRPALWTSGVSLLAFGVAHMLFITWAVPDRSGDPHLVVRLGLMLGAPMLIGSPFALGGAFLNALAWRIASGTRLASWRYGAALATAPLPAVVVTLVLGSGGDAPPRPEILGPVVLGSLVLPGLVASRFGGVRGLALGLGALPLAPLSPVILGSSLGGWVAPFVVSIFAILAASGALMERFVRRSNTKRPAGPPVSLSPPVPSSGAPAGAPDLEPTPASRTSPARP